MIPEHKQELMPRKRRPPATTLEKRENQLIALAVDVAQEQLENRTASSQVISHYLKLGTTREKIEKEILIQQRELIKAKTKAIQSGEIMQELYLNAMAAMKTYSGNKGDDYD